METLTSKETAQVLNDLIEINNDRITGYERALTELKEEDADLKSLFAAFIDQSRKIKMQLGREVEVLGTDINNGTTGNGKIYRIWMEIKGAFTGYNRHSILESCEYGEDAAQKAYSAALESDELPSFLQDIVALQKENLRSSHDEIKALRDQSINS